MATQEIWDAIIIGGGAAGLFCAGIAGQLGKKILVLDHAEVLGEKIRISGGGRCNFTNIDSTPQQFLSLNPHFMKSALARYPSSAFIDLVKTYGIGFHEKQAGQLFCNDSAKQIIALLFNECEKGNVQIRHPVSVTSIQRKLNYWEVFTSPGNSYGPEKTHAVVMATGGLPVPAIGASGFALDIAKQLGLDVVSPRAALVPLAFTAKAFTNLEELAGLSLPVAIRAGLKGKRYGLCQFHEDLLLTHKGISGPAVLQASSYWEEGELIEIDWLSAAADVSGAGVFDHIFSVEGNRLKTADNILAGIIPQRLAKMFAAQAGLLGKKWAEVGKTEQQALKVSLTQWRVKPAGTLGWNKAEVMLGGVHTNALNGQTMMARKHPGVYFIGECVDVTGHLGGHNFQWAWSSAYVCALAL
ncbi:MAG: aminoacetone oxidase family FAD-binding enzyme [Polynucleobacter sp.]|nr:aminoacetone oxidase family FAD-binding enzyme [Polynucleobacter sp.]